MLRTYCPNCDFPMSIAPSALGQTVQCRGCLHSYTAELPAPDVVAVEPLDDENTFAKARTARRQRTAQANKHTTTLLGMLGGSFVTLLVLVAGLTYMIAALPPKKPSTGSTTTPFNNYTPPPVYDGPKKIDDLVNEAPRNEKMRPAPFPGDFRK